MDFSCVRRLRNSRHAEKQPIPRQMAEKHARAESGLGPEAFAVHRREHAGRGARGLHICPACSSGLVHPVDLAPERGRRWSVALRCPDCEWHGEGIFAQEVVDRFDEVLNVGTEQLLNDLNLLARANMEEHVDRFAAALHADQILPEDF